MDDFADLDVALTLDGVDIPLTADAGGWSSRIVVDEYRYLVNLTVTPVGRATAPAVETAEDE